MLRVFQHCVAKGQAKKRWSISSSMDVLLLLLSIVLVFSLSTNISEANNLILGTYFDFQIHL
jgi:hypothetical protein